MGLLDVLGFASVPFGGNMFVPSPEYYAGMAQDVSHQVCIHPNCPICQERLDNQVKLWKEEQDKIAIKKQDYEKRYKEYMKRFKK